MGSSPPPSSSFSPGSSLSSPSSSVTHGATSASISGVVTKTPGWSRPRPIDSSSGCRLARTSSAAAKPPRTTNLMSGAASSARKENRCAADFPQETNASKAAPRCAPRKRESARLFALARPLPGGLDHGGESAALAVPDLLRVARAEVPRRGVGRQQLRRREPDADLAAARRERRLGRGRRVKGRRQGLPVAARRHDERGVAGDQRLERPKLEKLRARAERQVVPREAEVVVVGLAQPGPALRHNTQPARVLGARELPAQAGGLVALSREALLNAGQQALDVQRVVVVEPGDFLGLEGQRVEAAQQAARRRGLRARVSQKPRRTRRDEAAPLPRRAPRKARRASTRRSARGECRAGRRGRKLHDRAGPRRRETGSRSRAAAAAAGAARPVPVRADLRGLVVIALAKKTVAPRVPWPEARGAPSNGTRGPRLASSVVLGAERGPALVGHGRARTRSATSPVARAPRAGRGPGRSPRGS